jgi:ribonuclease D
MSEAEQNFWVATQTALESVANLVAATPIVAVDTEFVREKTYYPQLCLIQIATSEHTACIDCLAPLDLEPLYAQLFRPECTWVLHSARQDLEVIWQRTGRMPPQLIDTQIAGALVGHPAQLGLQALLAETLEVDLGADLSRTDWSRRPLPAAALRYALDDVRFLLAAWRQLEARLAALGRLQWLHEDCRRLLAEAPVADTVTIWSRLKGLHGLPMPAQSAALALVRWREREAQRADRPRRWILADETLVAVARAMPATRAELGPLLPSRFAAKHGGAILAAVAAARDGENEAAARANAAQRAPDKQRVKALQEAVRQRAGELGIEPEILATRRDLAALALGNAPSHLRQGWRAGELRSIESKLAARAEAG